MKFINKRDSPDYTLFKIILVSYLLSHIIMFFVMYNPWVYKRVYCPTITETETTIETEPTNTTYVAENIECIQPKSSMILETVMVEIEEEPTYYDMLTAEEINMIEATVQHEVGELSPQYKRLIAELIYNRLLSEHYPNDVKEMLFQKNQFTGINHWYYPSFPVDDETKEIVKDVFSKEDTPHNATAYYNPELSDPKAAEWFETSEYMTYLFSHSEESYGVTYTTRFFATEIPND